MAQPTYPRLGQPGRGRHRALRGRSARHDQAAGTGRAARAEGFLSLEVPDLCKLLHGDYIGGPGAGEVLHPPRNEVYHDATGASHYNFCNIFMCYWSEKNKVTCCCIEKEGGGEVMEGGRMEDNEGGELHLVSICTQLSVYMTDCFKIQT